MAYEAQQDKLKRKLLVLGGGKAFTFYP